MITTGVLGQRWRASVTPWGAVEPWVAGPVLDWHIAADDRWHSPHREAAVRQRRVDGTPVVETRVKVPDGDVVQTVYSVADHGGLTVVEVENSSPLPVAIAFSHGDLWSVRPPTAPIEGIDLPSDAVAFPLGHHATLTVALSHSGGRGTLPAGLPTAAGVARGWRTVVDRAGRMLLPDERVGDWVSEQRCELALVGPVEPSDDAVGFLLGVAALVRMGEVADDWVPDVAEAVELVLRASARDWTVAAALDGATIVLAAAGETRAVRDLVAARARLGVDATLPALEPAEPPAPVDGSGDGVGGAAVRRLAWHERRLVSPSGSGGATLLPMGMPAAWRGVNFEAYSLPVVAAKGTVSAVSFAVRWHGARPAVLWEQSGDMLSLDSPSAPGWHSNDVKGETLWPEPVQGLDDAAPGGSFV